MSKIAFLYPGQGAQEAGMAKDFYENSPEAGKFFDQASELLDLDLRKLCFEENDLLDKTEYTQAAMVAACLAITGELKKRGLHPDMTAGLSLGEYCAIAAAGGMSDMDAVRTVRARGVFMEHAAPEGTGAMSAILGMENSSVEKVIQEIEGAYIANYNCPGQIVITGYKEAVDKAETALKEAGAKRVMMLNVSGPFHSPMLKEAGEALGAELNGISWRELKIPYVTNVTAKKVTDIKETKGLLEKQVASSVRWEQSIRGMIADGVDTFVEMGPGKTLSGFMKKIDKNVKVYNIQTMEDLENVAAILAE